jgi:hypothetical protein
VASIFILENEPNKEPSQVKDLEERTLHNDSSENFQSFNWIAGLAKVTPEGVAWAYSFEYT